MPKDLHQNWNFRTPIHKVLKQVHPDSRITGKAMNEMNLMIHHVADKLIETCNQLMQHSKTRKTVTSREVQTSVRLVFPGELAKYAVSEGTKAVTKYTASKYASGPSFPPFPETQNLGNKKNKVSRSSRAGLQFPIGRVENLMRNSLHKCDRLGGSAPVYLAAALEYLTAEILELAGNAASDDKKTSITSRHILLAVANDANLSELFKKLTLSGGVLPHIQSVLLPQKKQESTAKPKKSSKKVPNK